MKKALNTIARIYSRFILWSYKVGGGVSHLPGNI